MAKCTIFSLSVSSLRRYTRILTSLGVILCFALGTLMYTPLTYAQNPTVVSIPIVVQFMSLGTAKSATVLFSGQKQPSQCVKVGNSKIAGSIPKNGMVSVEFFSSLDCSGAQSMPFFRFSALPVSMGGTVVCQSNQPSQPNQPNQSNTSCLLSPQSPNSPTLRANFMNLGTAKSATLNFRGQLIGGCITQNNSIVEGAVDNNPVIFSVNFFPTSDCSGGRKISSFRYSRLLRSGEATLTFQSERNVFAPSGVILVL